MLNNLWDMVVYPLLVGVGAIALILAIMAIVVWLTNSMSVSVAGHRLKEPPVWLTVIVKGVALCLFAWAIGMLFVGDL